MSRLSRSARLLQNAEAALLSAIEIYNKPTFEYREETFSILALNAWELLLKAKLLRLNGNKPKCLYVPSSVKTKGGQLSKKVTFKRNRTGNLLTLGLEGCLVALEKQQVIVPQEIKSNLEAMTEIRDNAVHYINAGSSLGKQVLEIGTASIRNFIELGKLWLGLDLSRHNLYLMPIGFLAIPENANAVNVSNDERRVVDYLARLMREPQAENTSDFHVSLDVNISFKRTTTLAAASVSISNDPDAIRVIMSEEDIRKAHPWDYATLRDKLKSRYSDFKENDKYHALKKQLSINPKYKKTRYLDPDNLKSSRKDFYSPNIISQFDKVYTLKVTNARACYEVGGVLRSLAHIRMAKAT